MGLMERFTEKYIIHPVSGCWLWIGATNGRYGHIRDENMEQDYAHRVSWRLFRGEIPEGQNVLHNCPSGDNPLCVNPDHLFTGTMADNQGDMVQKGRHMHGEGHYRNKLSEEDILDIRWMAENGYSYKVIGLQYDITNIYVGQIVRRKVWKHI
jgi:HNH endonuclease